MLKSGKKKKKLLPFGMADKMTISVLITLIYYPDAKSIMTNWRRSKIHRKFRNLEGFIESTLSRMEVWQGTYVVPKFILVTSHLKARRRSAWAVFPHKQEDGSQLVIK